MAIRNPGAAVGALIGGPRLDPFPAVHTEVDDHPMLASQLLGELRRQREDWVLRLIQNQPKTFDEYRNMTGKIEGLDVAIDICKKVQARLTA